MKGGIGWRGEHVWDTSVTDAKTCEVDFMTVMCLVRRIWTSLLEGACFCQREIQWFVIYLRIKKVRSDFVRKKTRLDSREVSCDFCGWVNGFVTLDTFMTGDPDKRYGEGNGWRVMRRVWIRVTRGWVEWTFEMADRTDRESETMRNESDCGKGIERISSRHWKMVWTSTVRIEAELRWREVKIWSLNRVRKTCVFTDFGPIREA